MQARVDYPLLAAEEFLVFDFGDRKAELHEGEIRMMGGATVRHSMVAGNLLVAIGGPLRGTGCTAYSSIFAVRCHDHSVRRPDISVFCGRNGPLHDAARAFDDPRVVVEVLSAGTARTDLRVKLDEYKAMPSVDTILFVDIATERVRIIQRTGPHGWSDVAHDEPVDVPMPALGLVIPHEEIFARD